MLGCFEPLKNILWVFYKPTAELDAHLVTFNHEYDHLIGILGRNLQIALIHQKLGTEQVVADVIAKERDLVESFVPAFLGTPTRLGPGIDRSRVAPESTHDLVLRINAICEGLHSCTWIMNGDKVALTLEQAVRAVQQATLNMSVPGRVYSAGASHTALAHLYELAHELAGRAFQVERSSHGEHHRLAYGPAGSKAFTLGAPKEGTAEHGEMLELLLVDSIRRNTGLEAKRYTLHDRAGLVLDWLRVLTSPDCKLDAVEILAGITSVFMPGVFLPFAGFYADAVTGVTGELHVLPFARPAVMPILRRSYLSKSVEVSMIPYKILELRQLPQHLLWQSNCPIGRAMSSFCEFATGDIASHQFNERVTGVLSRFGQVLRFMLQELEQTGCAECLRIREAIGVASPRTFGRAIAELCDECARGFTPWLRRHLSEEFRRSNSQVVSQYGDKVSIDTVGHRMYEYVDGPSWG